MPTLLSIWCWDFWEYSTAPAVSSKADEEDDALLDATISPPALATHKVFVGTGNGELVCLSAAAGEVQWTATIGGSIVFQPAVAEGRAYVSTETGMLYCIETGDPADDGWLMWGANAAHSGIVSKGK
jgi:outer membrane protein assembly factor BamB